MGKCKLVSHILVLISCELCCLKNTNSFPVIAFVLQHLLQHSGVEGYLDKIKLFPTENIEDRFPVDVFCENSSERHCDHCSQIHACTIGMIRHFVICAAYRFSNEIFRKNDKTWKGKGSDPALFQGWRPPFIIWLVWAMINDHWSSEACLLGQNDQL